MAVVVCPSCRREIQCDSPVQGMKCYHCLGLVDARNRYDRDIRQGLVRGTTLSFNRYTIEEQIGRGGFAITYRVTTQVGAQRVNRVIKEYFPNGFAENQRAPGTNSLVVRPEKMYQFATYSDAFKLEATHMDGLHDIRGVVRFYEFFQENETVYIVMQFVEGQPLSHYMSLQPQHYLQLDDAANIIRTVLRIMANVYRVPPMDGMHEAGKYFLLHRDLSLGNIMRAKDGDITIIDFGSSRFMYEQLDKSNKAHYTPVEQIENTVEQGQYTDVYAIGKMFYYLLCGSWPNNVTNKEWIDNKAKYDLTPVRNLRPEIPQIVDEIIKKATQYDYHNRYQTAEEFLKDMSRIGKGGKVGGKGGKSPLPAVLIGAGAVGVLVAVIMAMNSGKDPEVATETTLPPADSTTAAPTKQVEEIIREYAYRYAERGALLCTHEDVETAIATLLDRSVVYEVKKGPAWTSVMLNWNGEECTYFVQNRWLDDNISYQDAADHENAARFRQDAILVGDNHFLLPVNVQAYPTATPTQDVTDAPTEAPTPAPVWLFVKYTDEKGESLDVDGPMLQVQRGEEFVVIEAGKVNDYYEIPQTTAYPLNWGEDGHLDSLTVQCLPTATPVATPTPAPVEVLVRYVDGETGETLKEEPCTVTYLENFIIPENEVAGYRVQTAGVHSVVEWNPDGSVKNKVFVYRCVPIKEEKPVITEVPQPGLVNLGVNNVTLVYGQTVELEPVYQMYQADQWPELTFSSAKGCVAAEQRNGTIMLTALKYGSDGTDTLTISDGKNTHTLFVKVKLAVEKLSTTQVVLNGVEDEFYIDMILTEGAEVNDFRVVKPLTGLNVERVGTQIRISADQYVKGGTLRIDAGGRTHNIDVQMKDAITGVQLYRAPVNALQDRQAVETENEAHVKLIFSAASVQDEVLLISPETLSGTTNQIQCSGNAVFNAELGMYQVHLSDIAWLSDGAEPVMLTAGDSQVAVSVYTGEAINNLSWVRQMLFEPYAAGTVNNKLGLQLYPGVQIANCETQDERVATVSFDAEALSINAVSSGDTRVTVTLTNGEVVSLPLTVRQQIGQLKADMTSTCVGEEIVVQITTQGAAIDGEYTAALDNDGFSIVRQSADTLVLHADKIGRSVLTVTDAFGNSESIELRANTTVVGLSQEHVILQDGKSSEVQIILLEGKKLPANVQIINQLQGLEISRNDTKLTLTAEAGMNVRGTVVIDVDGEQFPLNVDTENRLEGVTVYLSAPPIRKDPAQWMKVADLDGTELRSFFYDENRASTFCLIFAPDTLSGSLDGLEVSDNLQYDEVNNVYYVDLNRPEFAKGEMIDIRMGDRVISARVHTGSVVLNRDEVVAIAPLTNPLKAGQTVSVPLSLHDGVTVSDLFMPEDDQHIAEVRYENGTLTIESKDSGSTYASIAFEPEGAPGEMIYMHVRQEMTGLTAYADTAYLGEQITVKVDSLGKPLEQEYTVDLSGSAFKIVKQEYDEIVLQAYAVGDAKLTVTDTFGTTKTLTLKVASVATGLNVNRIELTDGVTASVNVEMVKSDKLPYILIDNKDSNLQIKREQGTIYLTAKEGKYVDTTVLVVVDGVEYPLHVTTADRLEQVSVWYAKNGDLQKRDKWTKLEDMALNGSGAFCFSAAQAKDGCLVFLTESLSGSMAQVQTAGGLAKDENQGICYVRLDAAAYKKPGAAPLTMTLGNTQVSASVYTGDLVTNIAVARSALSSQQPAGMTAKIALQLYAGAEVEKCEAGNAKVAEASVSNGVLMVTGCDSGETTIRLTMAPTGEVIEIPVTVRQRAERLQVNAASAYVGEEIKVSVVSEGAPVAGEFTYSLDNKVFSIVKKEAGAVTVKAEQFGTSKLTVKDSFGNSKEVTLKAESNATGLSAERITLTDGEKQEIAFKLADGKKLTEQATVLQSVKGLSVDCSNGKIVLRTERGDYVQGTLKVELEGKTYQIPVNTQDRITGCTMAYPEAKERNYTSQVKAGTLYLNVKTLSGTLDDITVDGPWKVASAKNGVVTLETTGAVSKLAAPQTLKVLLDGRVEKEFTIEYPNALLNVPETLTAHAANSAISLIVGQGGFDTLFGTLEGVSYKAEGVSVTKVNDKTLNLVRDTAGAGKLTLTEKNGRSFSIQVPFDAYLAGATVNGKTVNAGGGMTLNLTEGDSINLSLNIVGGSRSQMQNFSSKSANENCVQISGSGTSLTLTARAPGSTSVTLADRYGSIKLNVQVGELWKFPNNSSTEEEIREVSTALRALGFQKGRTSSKWNADVENGVLAWKQAKGYAGGTTLSEAEYRELLAEGGVAVQERNVTATPVPAFKARTGENAALTDIAVGLNEIYLLDNKGWVIVMSKDGNMLDAFPAEESASYTTLSDMGDVPVAADHAQLYMLNAHIQDNLIRMFKHRNSRTYLYNIMADLQSQTVPRMTAMSQDSMIIVLPEATEFMVGSNIIKMSAGQAVYSLGGSELAPLYVGTGRSTLMSRIGAIALDRSTFAIATTDNRLYLFGAANGLSQHLGLTMGKTTANVIVTVDGKPVQQRVDQIALSDKNIALRMADGSVLVSGQGVPGQMGELIRERDTFVQCSFSGKAKDITLSDTALYILTSDGKLLACGKGSTGHCTQLLSGIAAISADDTYGYAITTDGKIYRIDGCSADQMVSQVKLP